MSSKIDKWDFLFGKWESDPETHVGDPDGSSNRAEIEAYPSNLYIKITNETWVGDELRSKSLQMLYYDSRDDKYKSKSFFPYGFVVNYVSTEIGDGKIVFTNESVEAQPADYDGTEFRYSMIKNSDDRFTLHLEMKAPAGEFFTFWNASYNRV